MPYSFESRVRYSETGEDGKLTLSGILNYFQDCSTFQSQEIGQGLETVKKRNRIWVISAWQVVVNRYPKLGEQLVISTFPYQFRGFLGNRNYMMDTPEGERIAYANSIWTYIDSEKGIPARLTEKDCEGYILEEKLDMEYAPRKIALPKVCTEEESFLVSKQHLDSNHHVNNCQYVRMAADYLPEGFVVSQMRVEYKQQAKLHHMIYPQVAKENEKVTVLLNDQDGNAYAVVEFQAQMPGKRLERE